MGCKRILVEATLASAMGLVIGYIGALNGMTTEQALFTGLTILLLTWAGLNWLVGNK